MTDGVMTPEALAAIMKFSLGKPLSEEEFAEYRKTSRGPLNVMKREVDAQGKVTDPEAPVPAPAPQHTMASPFDLKGKLLSPKERLRKKLEEEKKRRVGGK